MSTPDCPESITVTRWDIHPVSGRIRASLEGLGQPLHTTFERGTSVQWALCHYVATCADPTCTHLPAVFAGHLPPDAPSDLEIYWKAGFLRGAAFWEARTSGGFTMWQSDQHLCWAEAHKLYPVIPASRLNDARIICALHAQEVAAAPPGPDAPTAEP